MKRTDLLPNANNLMNSFLSNSIGRNKDVYSFINLINSIEGNYSLAIDSQWGDGKTFFVKQSKMILDALNKNRYQCDEYTDEEYTKIIRKVELDNNIDNSVPHITVYYDAWENDNDNDPMLSIVWSIISQLSLTKSFEGNRAKLDIISAIISFITDKNIVEFKENLSSENFLEDIEKNKNIKEKINDFIDDLFEEHGDRIVIFIDELDRCKPSYAVNLLERVKHYFINDRLTFVFSVNIEQLQHTIKQIYGYQFNGFRYLDRFFDKRLFLPAADQSVFLHSINYDVTSYTYDIMANIMIRECNMSLREQTRYIQMIKNTGYDIVHNENKFNRIFVPNKKTGSFVLSIFHPICVALYISDNEKYYNFICGQYTDIVEKVLNNPNMQDSILWGVGSYLYESNEIRPTADEANIQAYVNRAIMVYNAVFKSNTNQKIGLIIINDDVRKILKDLLNILSSNCNYDN